MALSATLQDIPGTLTVLSIASQGQWLCHCLLAHPSIWSAQAIKPRLCPLWCPVR